MADNIKSQNLKFSSNIPQIDDEIKQLSKSIEMSQRKLASLDENLKLKNGKSFDNLSDKINAYNKAISDTTIKLTGLEMQHDQLSKTQGIDPTKVEETQLAIDKSKQDLIRFNNELKTTQQQMLTINGRNFIDLGNKTKEVGKSLTSHLTIPIIKTIATLANLSSSTIGTGNEITTSVEDLGVISNETASKSEELANKLAIMQEKTADLKVSLAEGLYPAFEGIVQFITDSVIPVVQFIVDKFNSLSEEHKALILNIALVIAAIGPAMMIFGQLSTTFGTVMNTISMLKMVVTGLTESFSLATAGIGLLIGIVAMALLQNDEFKELLLELTEVFITLLKPVMKFAMILIDAIMPVIKILIQLLQPIITLLVRVAKVLIDVLIPPFNIFIDIINVVIGAINLLLTGLKYLTFGEIDIQIPTLEKVDLSSSRKVASEASSTVNSHNVNTFNQNINLGSNMDTKQFLAMQQDILGRGTS